jgi:hypothetical protein
MSTQVTTAFVQQYSANVQMLAQQNGSKLKGCVRNESVVGKQAFFDQIGATAARRRTSRHSDTPRMDTPHARRRVAVEDFDWADLIDAEDKVRTLIDPTSTYAMSAAKAMGRAMDEVMVDAALGTSYTGETGSNSVTLTGYNSGSQIIVNGATGMSVAKLIQAKQILDQTDVDSEHRYIAVTSSQLKDLLNLQQVTSSDYNTVKALVQGEIDTFLGFTFVKIDGARIDGSKILPTTTVGGSIRKCIAWQRDCLLLGLGNSPSARITERPDKNYATQVFYSMSIGATRMQEVGVVEIDCQES